MSPTTRTASAVAAGQEALARGAWEEARERFAEATATDGGPASAEAWEGLSWAAWWLGDEETTLHAREQAYRAFADAGDACGAARAAGWLGSDLHDFRGDDALAWVWLRRARQAVECHEPCRELGWILLLESVMVRCEPDPLKTVAMTREAVELARAIGDTGVEAVALSMLGAALIDAGEADEGVRRLDEAGALVVGDDFADAVASGWALCHTVAGCADVGDFSRAEQWARTLHRFSTAYSARQFFGTCRTAYGSVLTRRGDWPSAEEELTSALADLQAVRRPMAGSTAVRLGELRLRQGRHDEARQLFESAAPGLGAILGLGELALEQDDPTSAAEAAERVLRRLGEANVLTRFAALELLARARCAAGDRAGAQAAAANVSDAAARLGTPYMRARGALVLAEVLAGSEDHAGARQVAEDAADLFAGCSAPYEAARARLVLARALEGLGRTEQAATERAAAQQVLARLGARGDAAAATGAQAAASTDELSPRELDVLRLVAQGLSDAQIAERLFLSPHTVHRHVANVRTKLRLPSRTAAVAYAARAGLL
jgi:DNA-binding NarL/FixJ family response regulator